MVLNKMHYCIQKALPKTQNPVWYNDLHVVVTTVLQRLYLYQ